MGGEFATKKSECGEIRQLAQVIFSGGDASNDVLRPFYIKWCFYFENFFKLIDRRNGNYLRLPFNCSTLYQPYRTMQVFDLLKNHWIEKLIEEEKKALKR